MPTAPSYGYRFDPLQNLINVSWGLFLIIELKWSDWNIETINYGGLPSTYWQWTVPVPDFAVELTPPAGAALVSDTTETSTYPFNVDATGSSAPMPTGWNDDHPLSTLYHRTIIYRVSAGTGGSFDVTCTPVSDFVQQYLAYPGDQTTFPFNLLYTRLNNSPNPGGPLPYLSLSLSKKLPGTTGFATIYTASTIYNLVASGPISGMSGDSYPPAFYTWDNWFTTGIFKEGSFSIQVGNLADPGDPPKLAAWPQTPATRIVTNVSDGDTDSESDLKDYSLGIYLANAAWLPFAAYKFGGAPTDLNKYTGPFPTW